MTQRTMLLRHLRRGNSIDPRGALEMYGVARLAARIQELRDDGYHIETTDRRAYNRYGHATHFAEYRLGE